MHKSSLVCRVHGAETNKLAKILCLLIINNNHPTLTSDSKSNDRVLDRDLSIRKHFS